jgi:hypothetical protein
MPNITINNIPINFPNTAQSPDWSPAVIQFAKTVADYLATISIAGVVQPSQVDISAYNGVTNQTITGLIFNPATVRGAEVLYTVYRETNTNSGAEVGLLHVVYNTATNSWEISRTYTGDSKTSFNITSAGQIRYTNIALAGTGHTGNITFTARVINQTV